MSDGGKAVFLSYASQDAAAVRVLAEALRAAGVEVWFDQNELVGGDAWDAKIRKQIGACALFVPVISAATQARREGYFRLEWRLAAQRTHMMSEQSTFLLPVVIDTTRDAEADVPSEFKAVQWTRLRPATRDYGEVAPDATNVAEFCARIKFLLEDDKAAEIPSGAGSRGQSPRVTPPPASMLGRANRLGWMTAVAGLAAMTALLLWRPWSAERVPAVAPLAAARTNPEAEALIRRARDLIYDAASARNEFTLAEGFLRRATELAPDSAAAWGVSSLLNLWMVIRAYDPAENRLVRARAEAEKAQGLDPANVDSLLCLGQLLWRRGEMELARPYISRARTLEPQNPKVILGEMWLMDDFEKRASFLIKAAASVAQPAELHYYASFALQGAHRLEEAAVQADRSIAAQPFWRAYVQRALVEYYLTADPSRVGGFLERVPELKRDEPRVVIMRWRVAMLKRDSAAALQALDAVGGDYFEDNFFSGPKSYLLAQTHELAGRSNRASEEWRLATTALREKLVSTPGDPLWRSMLAVALAAQRNTVEALEIADLCATDERLDNDRPSAPKRWRQVDAMQYLAEAYARLGEPHKAVALLRRNMAALGVCGLTAPLLASEPAWQSLRDHPAFKALLEERSPGTVRIPATTPSAAFSLVSPDKSVAVLAFENLSDEKANESFSDGISEELLNVLAKIPGLKVSARTSAFYFKGQQVPLAEIARQLGVAYLVEGSVRKAGDKVRITAKLIKAADGFPVWSETFARDVKDIFAVQDEIAGLIATNLELKMGIARARPEIKVGAYHEYLTGLAAAAKGTMADLREAVPHFERAAAAEPTFTAAWVQLASAHTRLGRWGGVPTSQAWPAARDAIAQAQRLEPDSPDVLLALGWVLRTADWDWRGAERAFRRALQLQPNKPEALTGAAVLLFNIGQTEEAFQLGLRAAQLDPLNAATQIDLSLMFFFNQNWSESERSARRALQLAPNGYYHGTLSWSLTRQQRYAEAEAEIRLERDDIERANAWAILAIARGQTNALLESRTQLEAVARHRGADVADLQQSIAWIEANLGNQDAAFAALERARASRDPSMAWIRNVDYLAPLFSDPRWPALLRAMGLADDQLK